MGFLSFIHPKGSKMMFYLRAIKDQGTVIDRKNVYPCNHLDIGVLRLPILAHNQAGDRLMPS